MPENGARISVSRSASAVSVLRASRRPRPSTCVVAHWVLGAVVVGLGDGALLEHPLGALAVGGGLRRLGLQDLELGRCLGRLALAARASSLASTAPFFTTEPRST